MILCNDQLSQKKKQRPQGYRMQLIIGNVLYTSCMNPKWHISERLQKRLSAKIVNETHATFHSRADVPQMLLKPVTLSVIDSSRFSVNRHLEF